MENKVTLKIAGRSYTLVANEDTIYMEQVGKHVDTKVREVVGESKMSLIDGALLGALNIADEYFKLIATNQELHDKVKEHLEENATLKLQMMELTRKNFELQNKK